MTTYIPTVRNIINSIIVAINEHELIKNPPIYYPIPDENGEQEQIKIERYRNFDGIELIEPGLTVSVFPDYSSRRVPSGPITFKPYTLGDKELGFQYEVSIALVIAVQYQDVALERNAIFNYSVDATNYKVINHDKLDKKEARKEIKEEGGKIITNKTLSVEINPAEEIIRDYVFLLKYVLDDNMRILPWNIKSSQIESMDFPTTAWESKSTDIYFHKGYLVWNLSLYLPGSLKEYYATPKNVKETKIINISKIISY